MEDHVLGVLGLTLDITLGGPFLTALHFYGKVDVRSTAGIGDGLDGAEIILAGGAGEEAAEALEICVAPGLAVAAGVEVDALAIDLPDLDDGVADRVAFRIEQAAGEVGDLADGGGDAVVDDEKIVVGIEWEVGGVERTFGLFGGERELFGEGTGRGERQCQGADDFPAGPEVGQFDHEIEPSLLALGVQAGFFRAALGAIRGNRDLLR